MSAPKPQPSQNSPSTSARIAALRPGREATDPAQPIPAEGGTATFGAKKGATGFDTRAGRDRKVGGKPRFLGLMLTSALLVFLVAVAAWASFNTEGGLARILRPASETQIATRPDADSASPASGAAQLAALDTGDDAAVGTATISDAGISREDDAATGNWQDSTPAPAQLAAGERDTNGERPLTLEAPVAASGSGVRPEVSDLPYPAPTGVDIDLNARGVADASEGSVNADQVRVFAGLPPVVPPDRSSVLPDGAEEAQSVEDIQRLKTLGDMRPEGRPATLVEETESIAFQPATVGELASARPALRPAPAKAEAEEDTTATERAVVASLLPPQRPGDFDAVVEETRRLAAQVTPRTVEPAAPSGSTVSERATVRNAVDLRQLNLIGVYGEPSSRRALVRLPNGRYQKVKVGDRVDGGRIAAIGEDQLRYVKGGQNMTLRMP